MRDAALREVMSHHAERKTEPPVNMMTKTGDKQRPYILSVIPQHALIKKYKYYSTGLIVMFFISGAFVTWMINLRLAGT